MRIGQRLAGRLVSICGAFLLAACLAGCGLDGGVSSFFSDFGGDTAYRDEEPAADPVVSPPEEPPAPSADPFVVEQKPGGGGPVVDPESEAEDPGTMFGELKQLKVEIAFSGAAGVTTTDENGITYAVGSWVSHEDKVYPSEYWGRFPLYFFGQEVGVAVTVTNLGPRRSFDLVIRTEAYCLRTDGSNGAMLLAPQESTIRVMRGETVVVDSSFTADYVAGAESGLDRLIVKVLHPNVVDNPQGDEPALILQKEAVFCPPENEPPAGDAF